MRQEGHVRRAVRRVVGGARTVFGGVPEARSGGLGAFRKEPGRREGQAKGGGSSSRILGSAGRSVSLPAAAAGSANNGTRRFASVRSLCALVTRVTFLISPTIYLPPSVAIVDKNKLVLFQLFN